MEGHSEDLEFNPFFQALQTRFSSQYEQAQQGCWLVCIPTAVSLEGCNINKQFVDIHLLEPSVMLRDHYISMVGGHRVKWKLRGTHICSESSYTDISVKVKVLSEELAYNKSLQQFKMFVVERPLDPLYKPTSGLGRIQDALRTRKTYSECAQLLYSFSNCAKGLAELNHSVKTFFQSYIVVEVESLLRDDTASKLETMAKQAYTSFLESNRGDSRLQDRRVQDAVCFAIEGYLMHNVHSKVFPAICGVHAKQDKMLVQRCRDLRRHLTPKTLGVSTDYDCQYTKTIAQLNKMELLESPLERLYGLQDAMENVMEDVKDSFTQRLRHGEPQPLASDDLIALLATIIIQSNCTRLLSSLYYMENFHWSQSDADKLSYTLVTFRAAVEYIRGPEVERWLPKREERVPSVSPKFPQRDTYLSTPYTDEWNSGGSSASSSYAPNHTTAAHSHRVEEERRRGEKNPDRTTPKSNRKQKTNSSDLGPFLSQLVDDDTVTSSSFYDKPYS